MKPFTLYVLALELEELGRQMDFATAATKRFAETVKKIGPPWRHRLRDFLNRIFDQPREGK